MSESDSLSTNTKREETLSDDKPKVESSSNDATSKSNESQSKVDSTKSNSNEPIQYEANKITRDLNQDDKKSETKQLENESNESESKDSDQNEQAELKAEIARASPENETKISSLDDKENASNDTTKDITNDPSDEKTSEKDQVDHSKASSESHSTATTKECSSNENSSEKNVDIKNESSAIELVSEKSENINETALTSNTDIDSHSKNSVENSTECKSASKDDSLDESANVKDQADESKARNEIKDETIEASTDDNSSSNQNSNEKIADIKNESSSEPKVEVESDPNLRNLQDNQDNSDTDSENDSVSSEAKTRSIKELKECRESTISNDDSLNEPIEKIITNELLQSNNNVNEEARELNADSLEDISAKNAKQESLTNKIQDEDPSSVIIVVGENLNDESLSEKNDNNRSINDSLDETNDLVKLDFLSTRKRSEANQALDSATIDETSTDDTDDQTIDDKQNRQLKTMNKNDDSLDESENYDVRVELRTVETRHNQWSNKEETSNEVDKDDSTDESTIMNIRTSLAAFTKTITLDLNESYDEKDESKSDVKVTLSQNDSLNEPSRSENKYSMNFSNDSSSCEASQANFDDSFVSSLGDTASAPFKIAEAASSDIEDDALEFKYTSVYRMKPKMYRAQRDFFALIQRDDLVSLKIMRKLFNEQLKSRADMLRATEADVERALSTVDADQDGRIQFGEFVDLLQLFFANENNLAKRIEIILNGRNFGDLKADTLTRDEARSFFDYLGTFYGHQSSSSSNDDITFSDINTHKEFANLVNPILSKLVFLKNSK